LSTIRPVLITRSSPSPSTHRRRLRAGGALTAALFIALTGCSTTTTTTSHSDPGRPITMDGSSSSWSATAFRGDELSHPIPLDATAQAATFASTGAPTSLGALQQGQLMLVYFGYTHCPDVCPTTMADLGQALRQLPAPVQARTQVVFITSDPARDTPPVMKAWLSNFDPGLPHRFVGLTGTVTQIDTLAKSVGVPLFPPVTEPNGTITVQHGAQTLAFVDGQARVLWTAGTAVGDYGHDISALAQRLPPA